MMEQAKTIWRLVRFTHYDRDAHGRLSDHSESPSLPGPSRPGKEQHGRAIAPLICISMWLFSQAMVSVLAGSAAIILAGLFFASARLIHERFVLQPVSVKDESLLQRLFHPMRRLRGCPGWRMRDEGYL